MTTKITIGEDGSDLKTNIQMGFSVSFLLSLAGKAGRSFDSEVFSLLYCKQKAFI